MKLHGISASRIGVYDMCLFKYFLTYHLHAKMKSNFGALNGSIVHAILERVAEGIDGDWMDQLYQGYAGTLEVKNNFGKMEVLESPLIYAKPKEYAEVKPYCDSCPFKDAKKGVCSISQKPLDNLPGCPKDIFEETIDMVRAAMAKYKPLFDKQLVKAEDRITFELPGCPAPITCIVDLVLRDGDTIHMVDYKAGKFTKDFEACRDDVQVKTVSLAGRKKYIGKDGVKNVILTFDYFRDKPVTLAFTEAEDAAHEQYLIEKGRKMEEQKEVTRIMKKPESFWKCRVMCDPEVCNREWKGSFKLNEDDEVI